MKKLKTYIISLLALISFFSLNSTVYASSISLKATSSTSSTTVGNSFTVTFTYSSDTTLGAVIYEMTYDTDKLTLTDGTQKEARSYTGDKKSDSVTYTFKAKANGKADINFKINEALSFDEDNLGTPNTSKTININTQAEQQASYSTNNNLSSIKISNGELNPAFNKNTTEYNVTVDNKVTKITIDGTKEDDKASVDGFKEYDLDEGANKVTIQVTAQNGSSKYYTITINRKELDPIEVKTEDNKTLKIVRKKELLNKPNDYFTESTLKLDEETEVPSLLYKVNNKTITLVGLKDDKGEITLYKYEDKKYYPYLELIGNKIILINITSTKDIPEGYKEVILKVDDKEYVAYQLTNSDYYLVYGTNLSTGESNLYTYEVKEKTLQIYDKNLGNGVETQEKRVIKRNYVIYALAAFLIITYIGILISLIKSASNNKKRKEEEKELRKIRELEDEKRRKKERELKELEEKLKLKEEKITKDLKKKKKSVKIEENINNEKKKTRKKKES